MKCMNRVAQFGSGNYEDDCKFVTELAEHPFLTPLSLSPVQLSRDNKLFFLLSSSVKIVKSLEVVNFFALYYSSSLLMSQNENRVESNSRNKMTRLEENVVFISAITFWPLMCEGGGGSGKMVG